MSEHDLPELDADLRALLDAESELLEPPEGAFERVFERMSHTLLEPPPDGGGDGDGGDGSGGPPSHDTPSGSDPTPSAAAQTGSGSAATPATQGATTLATSTATLSLPTVAALAFALGLGAGAVGMRALGPEPEPTVRVEERIVERVVEVPVRVVETVYVHDDAGVTGAPTSPLGTAAPTAASGAVEARSTGTTHAADAGAGTAGDSAGSRDRDLADENALVSRAQAALARGRTSEALAAAAEHQRRFPRGEFVEEREALAIQALARSGNTAAAAARAERFRARYPRSMLLRAVNAAVGGSGSPPPAPDGERPVTRTRGTLTSACGALLALASLGCTMAVDLGGDGGEGASLVPFAGPRSSCILSDSGRLQCFGAGGAGQLSLEPASLHAVCNGEPCEFFPSTFALRNASSVALGDAFTCVVLEGAVWCAGSNAFGALARGTRDPDPHVQPLESDVSGVIVELAAGREHVCARRDDGTVACWGLGNHGALGVDPATLSDCGLVDAAQEARLGLTAGETRRCALDAVEVPGITDARGLRTGPFGTCVLRAGGAPLCFGRNVGGSLGVGMSASEAVSTPTALLVANATDVALGARHGCALDTLGRTHCFGLHDVGQLGVGNAAPDTCAGQPCAWTPLRVTDLASASRVVAGDEHTCVLLDDSQLRCFGNDTVGQVGNSSGALDDCGATPCARTPRDVVEGDAVAQVVASGNHTVLVTTDGTPMAFGSNVFRECSNATADVIPWPGTVYGISP